MPDQTDPLRDRCKKLLVTFEGRRPTHQQNSFVLLQTQNVDDLMALVREERIAAAGEVKDRFRLLRALMKVAHHSPSSTVLPVSIARDALVESIGTWQQGAVEELERSA